MKNSSTSTYSAASEDSHSHPRESSEMLNTSSATTNPSRKKSSRSTGQRRKSTETSGLLPTPSSQEPGWKHRIPLTKDGMTPTLGNQRWYDKETGRVMQKGLQ